ncbi:histidine phosphatase family protein [Micromonospora peucetia]|uniref:Histidine phosphatase family protein n=1 Tax=Micromonospora peucetia TaxID=47871 RepID=A0ABZ1E914_9ACTN|nr:histidine phosphatase family protein [Micromonospora peucetia]WSA31314.1 histidine phosphatase family protein [Micromonospora peucetia]
MARHGAADAFGELTDVGRRQAGLLGERLAGVPVDAVWHSPLPRAAASARELARHLPNVPLAEAAELVDHVPYVPGAAGMSRSWAGFFDGYDGKGRVRPVAADA